MFPDLDYGARIERARGLLTPGEVLMVSVGADLPYLTGYEAMPLERLTMLVLPAEGDATLVVPRLEAPRVITRGGAFAVRSWGETQDPVEIVAGLSDGAATAYVGDQTWSVFVLALQDALPRTRFTSAGPTMAEMRMRKEPIEIDLLRAAAEAADRVAGRLASMRFSGRSERELAQLVREMILEEGHDVDAWAIVASGPNGASPHHEPTDRQMQPGDAVVVDFGGRRRGYCSDTTRCFSLGEPAAEVAEAYALLQSAQAEARAAVRPGVAAEDVDAAARSPIAEAGRGDQFIHRTGHGIGLEIHEPPYIVEGNGLRLDAGMTFSVEPGIYVEGSFGLRIEDIVACTDNGVAELNDSSRDLRLVE